MNFDSEFQQTVQRYVEGSATADEMAQLNEQLRNDPEARERFIALMNLDSGLSALVAGVTSRESADAADSRSRVNSVVPPPRRKTPLLAMLTTLLMASVLVMVGAGFWNAPGETFATVVSATGVLELSEHAQLTQEWYEIAEGTVELQTVRGVRVVIEAPARFRFESAQRFQLSRGRLAADVPETGKKFTVVTPSGEAVDLGTKFGVDVPLQGEAEVHVFQGEVIAQSSQGGYRMNLLDGDAYRLQAGAGASRELRSAAFIRPDEVASLHAALRAGQPTNSGRALQKLRNDPALIALLDFEGNEQIPGVFNMVQGRWPGSRAPEFMNVGDHMKLNVGQNREFPQLTIAAWVRLDRFGDLYQSLLHTDGWDMNQGQVHWMVTDNRTMRLALARNQISPGQIGDKTYSDSSLPMSGGEHRWVHLAAVYDSEKKFARFYLDGEFTNEAPQDVAYPARLGPAQIGNWNSEDRKLSGRIDELILLARTMDDAEVRSLYDAGNPYK